MRVLLIDPVNTAHARNARSRKKARRGIGYPGLGLYTVAALTPPDAEVEVVDESVEEIDEGFVPDLVGISVQAPVAPRAYELSARFRNMGVPVALGGIHVTLNPEEAAEHADTIVCGEAELTWPRLIEDLRQGRIAPVYEANGAADLDASPRPRRDLMRLDAHTPSVVQASKGCPFDCEFCSLAACSDQKPRFRSIDRIVEEIRTLPRDPILFIDDNLYANRDFAKRLFRALAPLKRQWVGESTWHIALDDEVLGLARDSGCAGLFVGFDSINQQYMIRKVPPTGDPEAKYVQAIRNLVEKEIACVAAFVFGLDSDDTTVFERSLNVVREGGAHLVNLSVLVPYPGTPVFHRLEREGRITEWDWSKYVSPNVCFEPKNMSAEELHEGTLWAQREFFSLGHVVKSAVRTCLQLGWGRGMMALRLNLAQRRNYPYGTFGAGQV